MGRHSVALKRYIIMILLLPILFGFIAFIWVNPITKSFLTVIPLFNTVSMFYFLFFAFAGSIALLFELPFTRPDSLTSGVNGKLGTIGVGIVGFMNILFAALILSGVYNIMIDTSIINTLVGYFLMPADLIMFGVEIISILWLNKRYAFHGGIAA